MNWHDPDGVWQRSIRGRRALLLITTGVLLVSGLVPVGILGVLSRSAPVFSGWSIASLVVAQAIMLGALIIVIRMALRTSAVLKLVPKSAGRVCPGCVLPIAPMQTNASLRCPRCEASYTEVELLAHWRRYAISPVERSQKMQHEHFVEDGVIRNEKRLRAMRRSAVVFLLVMTFVWGSFAIFNALIWVRGIADFQTLLPFAMLGVAIVLVAFAWRAVDLNRRFCTMCHYEREMSSGELCPECGTEWNDPGATTAGRIVVRPGMAIASGLFFALAIGGTLSLFVGRDLLNMVTPTDTMINRIASADDLRAMTLYQNLIGRSLSPEQERQLIEVLLVKRERDELNIYDAQWLADRYVRKAIPADLLDQFHEGMVGIELVAPSSAAVGEPIQLSIRIFDRFSDVAIPHATAIVDGFYVGDDPTPRERPAIATPAVLLGDERLVRGITQPNHHAHGPRHTFVAERPGLLRIRLELWLLAVQTIPEASFIVEWREDGLPVIPPAALWSRHLVLEKEIEVVDVP